MNTNDLNRLSAQLQNELTGERDHDRELLLSWAERFRGDETAGPILREIGLLLYHLDEEETVPLAQGFLDDVLARTEQALSEAQELMAAGKPEKAIEVLAPAAEYLEDFPLSEDFVWMDFHSFLDGLLFEDYFSEEIDGREVRRHPLRPAELLRTYAEDLVWLERYEEAVPILERLTSLDPVCAEDLCALADVYLCAGRAEDAWDTAGWALLCASTHEEAARCYLLLAACRGEAEDWESAAILLTKSLLVQPSEEAEAMLTEIRRVAGQEFVFSAEEVNRRCEAMEVPTGRSEAVELNLTFLKQFNP